MKRWGECDGNDQMGVVGFRRRAGIIGLEKTSTSANFSLFIVNSWKTHAGGWTNKPNSKLAKMGRGREGQGREPLLQWAWKGSGCGGCGVFLLGGGGTFGGRIKWGKRFRGD